MSNFNIISRSIVNLLEPKQKYKSIQILQIFRKSIDFNKCIYLQNLENNINKINKNSKFSITLELIYIKNQFSVYFCVFSIFQIFCYTHTYQLLINLNNRIIFHLNNILICNICMQKILYIFKFVFIIKKMLMNTLISPTQELNFQHQSLSNCDLSVLKIINKSLLQKILLQYNNIESFEFLNFVSVQHLRIIDLNQNLIKSFNQFPSLQFTLISQLNLKSNKIKQLRGFSKSKFPTLRKLKLDNNQLSDIEQLNQIKFDSLEEIGLNNNKIMSIQSLKRLNAQKLKLISLCNNDIQNIQVINELNLQNIEILNLNNNPIWGFRELLNSNLLNIKKLWLLQNKTIKTELKKIVQIIKINYKNCIVFIS